MTYIDEINHTQTSLTRALFISKHWGCFSRPIKRKDSWDRHMDHSCCEYSTRLGKMQTYIVLYYLLNQLSPVCILTTLSDRIKVIICNLWGSFFCVKHVFFLYILHWFVSIHSFHWKKLLFCILWLFPSILMNVSSKMLCSDLTHTVENLLYIFIH